MSTQAERLGHADVVGRTGPRSGSDRGNPVGDKRKRHLRLDSHPGIRIGFHGARPSSDGGPFAHRKPGQRPGLTAMTMDCPRDSRRSRSRRPTLVGFDPLLRPRLPGGLRGLRRRRAVAGRTGVQSVHRWAHCRPGRGVHEPDVPLPERDARRARQAARTGGVEPALGGACGDGETASPGHPRTRHLRAPEQQFIPGTSA